MDYASTQTEGTYLVAELGQKRGHRIEGTIEDEEGAGVLLVVEEGGLALQANLSVDLLGNGVGDGGTGLVTNVGLLLQGEERGENGIDGAVDHLLLLGGEGTGLAEGETSERSGDRGETYLLSRLRVKWSLSART